MEKKIRILLIEDLPSDIQLIWRMLDRGGVVADRLVVENREGFIDALESFSPDIILSDHNLPSFNSHEALEILQERRQLIPFILITAGTSEKFAMDVIRRGAVDYVLKDRLERLPAAVRNSIEKSLLEKEKQSYFDELVRNEKHYRSLIGSIHDAIILVDEDLKLIYQSPSADKITGYSFTEVSNRTAFDYVHPDDLAICMAMISEVDKIPGLPVSDTYRIRHKNGELVWIECTITNLLHDDSAGAYIFNYRDITGRKQAEQGLQQSEFRYRQIVETAQEGIWLLDENNVTTFVNQKLCEIIGYERDEIIGRSNFDFMLEADQPAARLSFGLRRTGNLQNINARFITKAGKVVLTNIAGNALFDEGGIYRGILGMVSDITENKRLQGMLDRVNKLARVGSWEADVESGKVNWSDITCEIHEVEHGRVTDFEGGIGFYKTGVSREKIMSVLEQAMVHGLSWDEEFEITSAKGNDKWVRVTGEAEAVNGSCRRLYGSFQDITKRKQGELDLLALNQSLGIHSRDLALSNAELEQFAYVASHDLQEPLRMVTSFLNQIEKKYSSLLDDQGRKYIHFAVDGAVRMRQIILDLLEFSRAGKTQSRAEPVDLNEVVTNILLLFRTRIEETEAIIHVNKLPTLLTHKGQLHQVLQNLISNSLKYCAAGRKPEIYISYEEKMEMAEISVADNGIGIDPEYFEKIFVIFQRLHNKDEYSGTGMGLAICKKMVEALGGTMGVSSEPEAGSRFYFTLPLLNQS